MSMLDLICYIAGLWVLLGCLTPPRPRRGKPYRDPKRPWMLYYRDGSWEVDTNDPQWQASFRKHLKDCEKLRRAHNNRN